MANFSPALASRYDTYADIDLDQSVGNLDLTPGPAGPLTGYDLVMFMGKPEYMTEGMVVELIEYMEAGGSLLGVSGNTLVWKCATGLSKPQNPFGPGQNLVFEARKWPCSNNLIEPGFYEHQSWAEPSQKLGGWRFLESCVGGYRDAIFGTRPIQAGGFCLQQNKSDDYGKWQIAPSAPHRYLEGLLQNGVPVADGDYMEVGTVVGPEADAFFMDDLEGGAAIPILKDSLPYSADGNVTRLAQGWGFYGVDDLITIPVPLVCSSMGTLPPTKPSPEFQFIDWTSPDIATSMPAFCSGNAITNCAPYGQWSWVLAGPLRFQGFGNIVTYDYQAASPNPGGGSVLHIASIESPKALRNDHLATNSDVLSNLVGRFVKEVVGP